VFYWLTFMGLTLGLGECGLKMEIEDEEWFIPNA
jgi:hypothetical protein